MRAGADWVVLLHTRYVSTVHVGGGRGVRAERVRLQRGWAGDAEASA